VIAHRAIRAQNVRNSQIDVGGQSAVELYLAPAYRQPLVAGREVQETQVHGFLELVRNIADQEDRRGVCLTRGDERTVGSVTVLLPEGGHEPPH
jgi:hypothetical protein